MEEYIEGREFYVGVLGNSRSAALSPIEMDFSGMPEGKPHVLDAKAKWDEKSPEYKGTKAVLAELPDELRASCRRRRWTPTGPSASAITAASTCG